MNKRIRHPEQKENEIFLINAKDNEDFESNLPDWILSTRRGNIAYKTNSYKIVKDMKPIFAVLKDNYTTKKYNKFKHEAVNKTSNH